MGIRTRHSVAIHDRSNFLYQNRWIMRLEHKHQIEKRNPYFKGFLFSINSSQFQLPLKEIRVYYSRNLRASHYIQLFNGNCSGSGAISSFEAVLSA